MIKTRIQAIARKQSTRYLASLVIHPPQKCMWDKRFLLPITIQQNYIISHICFFCLSACERVWRPSRCHLRPLLYVVVMFFAPIPFYALYREERRDASLFEMKPIWFLVLVMSRYSRSNWYLVNQWIAFSQLRVISAYRLVKINTVFSHILSPH